MNWNVIVEDRNVHKKVSNKIDEIYQVIVNYYNKERIGLLGGYSGSLLFLYYYWRYTQKEEHFLMLQEKCTLVLKDFIFSTHSSYCSGYAGICWLIRFLTNEGIVEISDTDKYLNEMDKIIHQIMLLYLKENNFDLDFLHGGLGIAYYFSTQYNKNGEVAIKDFFSTLDEKKISDSDGSVKWKTIVHNGEEKFWAYNLGLSHGMAGIVAYLQKVIESHNNEMDSREFLLKTTQFYKKNTNPPTFRSVFSPWIPIEKHEYIESRLAWCYGDLGICPVLYKAGMLLNDSELAALAINTLVKSCNRRNHFLDSVADACICHGTSGISHIYNRMYQLTNLSVFKNSALYWLDETLKMGNNDNQLAGYSFLHSGEYASSIDLLTGISGVGLSLLASIDSVEPKWDECLMLS